MLLFFVLCDNKCYIFYHLGLQKIFFTYRRFRNKTIRLIEKIISILICDKKKIAAALFTFSSKMRVFVLLCFWFWLQRNVPTMKPIVCVCMCVLVVISVLVMAVFPALGGDQTPDRWHWSVRLSASDWCDLWMDNYRRHLWETNCTQLPKRAQRGGSGPRGHGLPSLTELETSSSLTGSPVNLRFSLDILCLVEVYRELI